MQGDNPQSGRSNYLDFELEISEGRGREYPVAVLRSPAGEARETMYFPFDEVALDLRLGKLQIALLRSGGKHRKVLSEEEQAVQNFGQALFDALLSREIRSCYDLSLREAAQQDKGLRLKLRIHPPKLCALPWEFMYDPRQADYVCLSRQTPIVRYLESPRLIKPLTVTPPLRILGMVASPKDLPALDVEHERERVERAVQMLRQRGLVELEWLEGQTWRDLQLTMWGGPWHVFHFIGHGGFDQNADEGVIALADHAGRPSLLSATRLGRLLADHTALRLVLLNACEGARGSEHDIFSSTAAILVRRGIPAVVAMQYEITDRTAIELARAFYQALAHGMAVDEAVVVARKAISLAVTNTVEWGTPVLYMRSPDGVLFQIAETLHVKPSPIEETEPLSEVEDGQKQRSEQIAALYAKAQEFARARQWHRALAKMGQIHALDPQFADLAGIATKAQQEVAKEDRETQQQRKMAAPPKPVSARLGLPQGTLIVIGALVLIIVLAVGWAVVWPMIATTAISTPTLTPTSTPPAVITQIWEKDDSVMAYVPPGAFWMGSDDSDPDVYFDEQPQHEVYLDAFWIDRTEVTNAMFARFVADTGYETDAEKYGSSRVYNPSSKEREDMAGADWRHPYGPSTSLDGMDRHPVVHVSWNDAAAYCQWTGKRLPTEAEWEKAARGTDKRIYPWGNTFDGSLLNFCDVNCELSWKAEDWDDGYAYTAPVGTYDDGASLYGVLDIAGNVWEWVADWYDDNYYANSLERNPQGSNSGGERVLRGGSWFNYVWLVRSTLRFHDGPSYSDNYIGFRCARSVSEP